MWALWVVLALVALFFIWAAVRLRGRSGDATNPRDDREGRLWNQSGGSPPGLG